MCVWFSIMSSEYNKDQELNKLRECDYNSISPLVQISMNGENELLNEMAKVISENLTPTNWIDFGDDFMIFFLASFEFNQVFNSFSSIFERIDMVDFSSFVFDVITKNIGSNVKRTKDLVLFIVSRAGLNNSEFFGWGIKSLYSKIVMHMNSPNFASISSIFYSLTDFNESLTAVAVQELMKESLLQLAKRIRDGESERVNILFLNSIKFWAHYAFQYQNFEIAFITLCIHSIRCDLSLKLNPYRLHILEVLIMNGQYIHCISPLIRILTKSFSSKTSEEIGFDFDTIIVADKSIARTKKYQTCLFEKSIHLIKACLNGLKNRIAFPEIVAPLLKALTVMLADSLFEDKKKDLNNLKLLIQNNTKWVQIEREKEVTKGSFRIAEVQSLNAQSSISFE